MFLKSLSLKGFKSFADPATLRLEPGVTVVVGPNGSGKSNVVDAVAWVLGAQGPRSVRGQKMEDVIFAGSADRPALGRAEVALTIDNRAGRLAGGLAEITITRTLFRSGESEYALNGQPCRLLDIQELLSDSGVGRSQHVIVGQGQLDQVLNARPEDRRAVIEEAAGVLKHRRRRERAERRLAAAEENLERLGDLLREVRRQIRPLERQAAAARSHGALAAELRALRLHLVGQDLAHLDRRRRGAGAERQAIEREERDLRAAIAQIDAAVDTATAELSAQREEDIVIALTRVQGLAERSRGLVGMLAERRRALHAALDAAADADVVSSLETDAARLQSELDAVAAERAEMAPALNAAEAAESARASESAARHEPLRDPAAGRDAPEAHAVAQARAESARRSIERDRHALQQAEERSAAAASRHAQLVADVERARAELAALEASVGEVMQTVAAAEASAAAAAAELRAAEQASDAAEREWRRIEARSEALARALHASRGVAGTEALAGERGVLGALAELVDVDEGWGPAFEAAVGGALAAVVVAGPGAARGALTRLHEVGAAAALLTVPEVEPAADRFGAAPASRVYEPPIVAAPAGCVRLGDHVRTRTEALEVALHRLVGGVVVAVDGWEAALDVAVAHPDLVVVTPAGDRFAPSGWVLRGGDGSVTPSMVEDSRLTAARAGEIAGHAAARARAGREAADAAALAVRDAARGADRLGDRRQTLSASVAQAERAASAASDEVRAAERQRAENAERLDVDAAALRQLDASLPALLQAAERAADAIEDAAAAATAADERHAAARAERRSIEMRVAALDERGRVLGDRLAEVERRLAGRAEERAHATERRQRILADAAAVDGLSGVVDGHRARLEGLLSRLRELRSRQLEELRAGGEQLEDLRRRRSVAESTLNELRDRHQRLELELAESGGREQAAREALQRELGVSPDEALGAPCPDLPDGVSAGDRASSLEVELAKMGPVNPLAVEELSELEERHQFLESQVEDVRHARRELHQVIRAVDDEITRLFAEAFADVNEHFQNLVGVLFPGGSGRLSLTEPTDLLASGVEVEARPAGKQVRRLSLLSGGERSLVALAFLFAVFRSRPSPFYLLDEVEAALDDVNLHRFLGLLHEFRGEAQLIIVSHQKRTMESADALYGVTMTPGGSSKVVSQKVSRPAGAAHVAPLDAPESGVNGLGGNGAAHAHEGDQVTGPTGSAGPSSAARAPDPVGAEFDADAFDDLTARAGFGAVVTSSPPSAPAAGDSRYGTGDLEDVVFPS